MNTMTPQELGWVAGLLEGEGCFSSLKNKEGTLYGNICIQCHMTDQDVLQKLHRVVGVGHVNGPYKNGGKTWKAHYKLRWTFTTSGSDAYDLMKAILPLMGERRSAVIRERTQGYEDVPTRKILNVTSGVIEETRNINEWCRRNGIRSKSLNMAFLRGAATKEGWRRLS